MTQDRMVPSSSPGKSSQSTGRILDLSDAEIIAAAGQRSPAGRIRPAGRQLVVFLSCDKEMKERMEDLLKPVSWAAGYTYVANPQTEDAISSTVVVMDVRPHIDAKMHAQYDQVLRIKKYKGRFGKDLLCVVGPASGIANYSRGTYGELYFFVYDASKADQPQSSVVPEGVPVIGGPRVFDFADIAEVLRDWFARRAEVLSSQAGGR
jgi:hypothetical protein